MKLLIDAYRVDFTLMIVSSVAPKHEMQVLKWPVYQVINVSSNVSIELNRVSIAMHSVDIVYPLYFVFDLSLAEFHDISVSLYDNVCLERRSLEQ